MSQDYSEAPLSPDEAEAVRLGAIVVRVAGDDAFSRMKALMEGISIALGTPMPTDEELRARLRAAGYENEP